MKSKLPYAAEEELDIVKVYDNALRFEKKYASNPKAGAAVADGEDGDIRGEFDYVEFYWDNNTAVILEEKGVYRHGNDLDHRFDTARIPAPPVQTTIVLGEVEVEDKLTQIAKGVIDDGYEEVDHFLNLHRVHLPCFTWVGAGEEEEEGKNVSIYSTQIGGFPALYEGEESPKYCIFCFQIDLETIPPDSGKFRIIPKEGFSA